MRLRKIYRSLKNYDPGLEARIQGILKDVKPDMIHIFRYGVSTLSGSSTCLSQSTEDTDRDTGAVWGNCKDVSCRASGECI